MAFQMSPRWSPSWQRFFAQAATTASPPPLVPPASVPAHPSIGLLLHAPTGRQDAGATRGRAARDGGGTSSSAAPPARPRLPVDRRPTSPEPRRQRELDWLTWQLSARLREDTRRNLRGTLDWRAQQCQPLDAPKKPPEYTRFGLRGEQLVPIGAITLCKTLRAELRESVRMLEGEQSRTERNRRLAMHSVRLGQLCAELEQRGLDVLEEVRNGLAVLWA